MDVVAPELRQFSKAISLAKDYWSMVKSPQTGLLLTTGLAGYMSARCPIFNGSTLLGLAFTLFLAISGSTVLNMWYDRDIDAKMARTCRRPLPAGKIQPHQALILGICLTATGAGLSFILSPLYGAIVLLGVFFDFGIYTLWLKRQTPLSIIWGGIAGGMPVLAGRALGMGFLDSVGIWFALGVFFWIPTHIMTFNIRYAQDYLAAGVPTFPSTYGMKSTQIVIALSSILAALSMGLAALGLSVTWGTLRLLAVMSSGLFILAATSMLRPSERTNFGLFKYASLYMFSAMLLVVLESI